MCLHILAGWRPIHEAMREGEYALAIIRLLVEHGADLNAKSDTGSTPLHDAVAYMSEEIVKYLVDSGADPTVENLDGRTPVDVAKISVYGRSKHFLRMLSKEDAITSLTQPPKIEEDGAPSEEKEEAKQDDLEADKKEMIPIQERLIVANQNAQVSNNCYSPPSKVSLAVNVCVDSPMKAAPGCENIESTSDDTKDLHAASQETIPKPEQKGTEDQKIERRGDINGTGSKDESEKWDVASTGAAVPVPSECSAESKEEDHSFKEDNQDRTRKEELPHPKDENDPGFANTAKVSSTDDRRDAAVAMMCESAPASHLIQTESEAAAYKDNGVGKFGGKETIDKAVITENQNTIKAPFPVKVVNTKPNGLAISVTTPKGPSSIKRLDRRGSLVPSPFGSRGAKLLQMANKKSKSVVNGLGGESLHATSSGLLNNSFTSDLNSSDSSASGSECSNGGFSSPSAANNHSVTSMAKLMLMSPRFANSKQKLSHLPSNVETQEKVR